MGEDGGQHSRKQKKVLNRAMRSTAIVFTTYPILPIQKGPLGRYFRPENRLAANGIAYETVLRITNEPVKSRKAAELPSGIAPSPIAKMA